MRDPEKTVAHIVELLSVCPARIEGQPVAVLRMRLEPQESFESINLALSKEQAYRLWDDLNSLFETSTLLGCPPSA